MNEKKLSVRIYEPLLNAFQEHCRRHNLTQSEIIRDQIKEVLNFQGPEYFEKTINLKDFYFLILQKIKYNIEFSLNEKYNILIQTRKAFWDNYLIRDNKNIGLNSPDINNKSGLIYLDLLEKLEIYNCGISIEKLKHELNLFALATSNNPIILNEQATFIKTVTEFKCEFNSRNKNIIWPIVLEGLYNILSLCATKNSLIIFNESFNQIFDLLIYPVFCLNFKELSRRQDVNLTLPEQILAGTAAIQSDYLKGSYCDEVTHDFDVMIHKYYS